MSNIVNLDSGYFTLTDRVTKSNSTGAVTYQGDFGVSGKFTLGSSISGTKANVTQSTSITTAVTANGYCGIITTVSSTLATDTLTSFTLNNSTITSSSIVLVNLVNYSAALDGSKGSPQVWVAGISSGSCTIVLANNNGTNALAGTLGIGYLVIN